MERGNGNLVIKHLHFGSAVRSPSLSAKLHCLYLSFATIDSVSLDELITSADQRDESQGQGRRV